MPYEVFAIEAGNVANRNVTSMEVKDTYQKIKDLGGTVVDSHILSTTFMDGYPNTDTLYIVADIPEKISVMDAAYGDDSVVDEG